MKEILNRINRRLYLISNLEKIIEDSIYYRSFSSEMNESKKIIIGNFKDDSAKAEIK
jgi:hypothetical protein